MSTANSGGGHFLILSSSAMRYNGFISYSHAGDAELAAAVHSSLHRLARPWYSKRALWIWRDQTSLSANPALWGSIQKALANSEYFLLMASPESARSAWVGEEVGWWLRNRSPRNIIIVLTGGELKWDSAARAFDGTKSTALPEVLKCAYSGDQPLYVDLRWARGAEQLSLRHSQFRQAVLDVAAALHGKSKEDLDGEDVRQHRRSRRLAQSAGFVIAVLAVAATFAAFNWYRQSQISEQRRAQAEIAREEAVKSERKAEERRVEAEDRRREAEEQRAAAEKARAQAVRESEIALARRLIVQSELLSSQNPERQELSLLLAIEGMRRFNDLRIRSVDADRAVRRSLLLQSRAVQTLPDGRAVSALIVSPNGNFFADRTPQHEIAVYRTGEANPIAVIPGNGPILAWSFSRDSRRFAATNGRRAFFLEPSTGNLASFTVLAKAPTRAAFSRDAKLLAVLDGSIRPRPAAAAIVTVQAVDTGELSFQEVVPTSWKEAGAGMFTRAPASVRDGLKELLAELAFRNMSYSKEDFGVRRHIMGPAGRYMIATGYVDEAAQVYLYDPTGGRELGVFAPGEQLPGVDGSPDGQILLFSLDDTVRLGRVPEGTDARRVRVDTPLTLRVEAPVLATAFSPDSRFFVTVTARAARVWSAATGAEICRSSHDSELQLAAYGGGTLVTRSDGLTQVGSCQRNIEPASHGRDGAIHPDGKAVASLHAADLEVATTAGGKKLADLTMPRGYMAVVWSENGRRAAAGRHGVPITVWNWPSGVTVSFHGRQPTGRPLAFSTDGRYLAIGENYTYMEILDVDTGVSLRRIPTNLEDDVTVGAGGRFVLARNFSFGPTVWNVRTGKIAAGGGRDTAASLTGHGARWARWVANGFELKDLESGQVIQRIASAQKPTALALSPGGRFLAAANSRVITVYDIQRKSPEDRFTIDYPARALVFHPNEAVLATLNARSVQIRDVSERHDIAQLPIDRGWFEEPGSEPWLRFLPGARMVALVEERNQRVWYWQPRDMMFRGCRALRQKSLTHVAWRAFFPESPYRATCDGP